MKPPRKTEIRICACCRLLFRCRTDKNGKYCSFKCGGIGRRKIRQPCKNCGNPVKQLRCVFCSNKCKCADRHKQTVLKLNCDWCGKPFEWHQCHVRYKSNCCSKRCSSKWVAKNLPPSRLLPIGSEQIRNCNGDRRAWVKTQAGWVQRSLKIVCDAGFSTANKVVHHKDRNTLNDSLENLEVLTRAEHARLHMKEIHAAKRIKKLKVTIPEQSKKTLDNLK